MVGFATVLGMSMVRTASLTQADYVHWAVGQFCRSSMPCNQQHVHVPARLV